MSAPSQYGGNLRTLEDIQCVCLLPAKCRVLSSDTLTVREYYCSCCSSEEFSTVGCLISSFYFGDRPLQRSNLCKPKRTRARTRQASHARRMEPTLTTHTFLTLSTHSCYLTAADGSDTLNRSVLEVSASGARRNRCRTGE